MRTAILLICTACSAVPGGYRVDLRTDLTPGVEFDRAQVILGGEPTQTTFWHESEHWFDGARVAHFVLEPRDYEGTVLLSLHGVAVLTRPVRISVRGELAQTIVLDRSCVGVECPDAGGSPAAVACLGGRCVDSTCLDGAQESCPEPLCSDASQCSAPASCTNARCIGAACLAESICSEGTYCAIDTSTCESSPPRESPPVSCEMDFCVSEIAVDATRASMSLDGLALALWIEGRVRVYSRDTIGADWNLADTPDSGDLRAEAGEISGDGSVIVALENGSTPAGGDDDSIVVYEREEGSWPRRHTLEAPVWRSPTGRGPGLAVSGNGRTIARVGVLDPDAPASPDAVFVFVRDETGWVEQQRLMATNGELTDSFGYAIAMNEDASMILIGAPYEDSATDNPLGNEVDASGAVYVFERIAGIWTETRMLKAPLPSPEDEFGATLALSADGSTLVVGARSDDTGATGLAEPAADDRSPNSGAAYVYRTADWSMDAYTKATNAGTGDEYGNAVAVSATGDVLLVGARAESADGYDPEGDSAPRTGAAYVWRREPDAWEFEQYLKPPELMLDELNFGSSVSMDGTGTSLVICGGGHFVFGAEFVACYQYELPAR